MHPFFFGTSERRLFAVYHAAEGHAVRGTGVVFCYPIGHEHIRSYRMFKNLAGQLTPLGLHALRFDYYGSGDSAGESDEGSIAQWVEDIGTAVDELKDMTGLSRVSLLGLRFGANLAALAASGRTDIDSLVLWDPLESGRKYLQEVRAVQEDWFRTRPGPRGAAGRAFRGELLGFPLSDALAAEFELIDARDWSLRINHLAVLVSEEANHGLDWRELAGRFGVPSTYRCVPGAGEWDSPSSVNRSLLPHDMMRTIVQLFTDRPHADGPREPRSEAE